MKSCRFRDQVSAPENKVFVDANTIIKANKKINAGNFGDAGAMSFYTTKVMTTGEGGMITTNNKNIYENIISLREFGFIKGEKTKYDKISSNFKLSEFSALLGLIELKRVRLRIQQRNKIAKRYQKYFQKNSNYNLLKEPKNTFSNYYKQIFLSSFERIKIKTILESNNIPLTGGVYYTPIHKQPVYRNILKKSRYQELGKSKSVTIRNLYCFLVFLLEGSFLM